MSENYKIALVDDHHLVRAGLSALVKSIPDFSVVATSDNAATVEHWLESPGVDVLLLDISLRGQSGLSVLSRLQQSHPDLPVIMLSMHDNRDYVLRALREGASGYLLKDAAEAELELALRSVITGGRYLSPGISGEVVSALLGGKTGESGIEPLTTRQQQILELIASGQSTKEIAYSLDISPKTVDTYRAQIMSRLGIHDIAGLVKYAIRCGLISME